jgi:hypothetical protein
MISFTGPGVANSQAASILRANGVVVGADGSVATGFPSSECTKALLFLRQTLLNPRRAQRSTVDAMSYAASLGVTTHHRPGARSRRSATRPTARRTKTTSRCTFPFLEVYDQGKGLVRLRINFPAHGDRRRHAELVQRLKNAFQFFGGDMVKSGGIGEFIAQGTTVPGRFLEAARKVGKANWRAEVHSLGRSTQQARMRPDFVQEITAFETVTGEFPAW